MPGLSCTGKERPGISEYTVLTVSLKKSAPAASDHSDFQNHEISSNDTTEPAQNGFKST